MSTPAHFLSLLTSEPGKVPMLNEASLARVYNHVKNRGMGMVTAYRGEYTREENEARNKELEAAIKIAGFGYIKVKGRYVEDFGKETARNVDEASYLVIGSPENDDGLLLSFLKNLGRRFGQDAVLYKPFDSEEASLYGTREGGFPGLNTKHDLGPFHPNRAHEFHTAMKGGRTFTFDKVEFVRPVTFSNREEKEF